MIPPEELWGQYKLGNVTESEIVLWSIDQYVNHRASLQMSDADDWNEEQIREILSQVALEMDQDKAIGKLYRLPGDLIL
jgi:hypothetical protein